MARDLKYSFLFDWYLWLPGKQFSNKTYHICHASLCNGAYIKSHIASCFKQVKYVQNLSVKNLDTLKINKWWIKGTLMQTWKSLFSYENNSLKISHLIHRPVEISTREFTLLLYTLAWLSSSLNHWGFWCFWRLNCIPI